MKIGFGAALWMRDSHLLGMYKMFDDLAMSQCDGCEMHFPYIFDAFERTPAKLKNLLDMHDLSLASVFTRVDFASDATIRRDHDRCLRMMDFIGAMGGEHVLFDEDYSVGGNFYVKRPRPADMAGRISLMAETANKLGEESKSRGLKLSWHIHWGTVMEEEQNLRDFMAKTDPALVGFCPDTAQMRICGQDVVGLFRDLIDRIQYVHYKDVEIRRHIVDGKTWCGNGPEPGDDGGYRVDSLGRMVELGRGEIDFPAITKILKDAGYDGWIIDDFDYTGYRVDESIDACVRYLNHTLGIWGERQLAQK